ncbi:MAG: type IV toxin-antitoxin system AbiEi family antitoxin domain-containing protein, partial [Acidimicrobiia bacterium]
MADLFKQAYDVALRNGGVVTRQELLDLGFTEGMIEWRLRRKQWEVVTRGTYRLAEPSDRRDLARSVLATWPGAVLSHESAAAIHGFRYVKETLLTVSHHSRTTHTFPGVVVRRTHDLDSWHVTEVDGVRVTTIARTVVDLAADRPASLIGRIVDDLVSADRLELVELEAVVNSVARRGKPGMRTMHKVLDVRIGPDRDASVLERRGREIIRRAGLPLPIPEYPIPWTTGRRFDDAYPEIRVAIEWDSKRFHGQRAAFEADRARNRDAAIHGWRILRFT